MKLDVIAQLETNPAIVIQDFPRGGKPWHELHISCAHRQTVKDLATDTAPGDQKGVNRIPATWVTSRGCNTESACSMTHHRHCERRKREQGNCCKLFDTEHEISPNEPQGYSVLFIYFNSVVSG